MERKTLQLTEFKLSIEQARTFKGYASTFGNIDHHGDVIEAGAFTQSVAKAYSKGDWPLMLSEHGFEGFTPVGVWTEMEENSKGLLVTGKLADTARGNELYQLMKMEPRPAINAMSIGFKMVDFSPRSKPEDPRRRIKNLDLMEISIVTMPANPKARIGTVKSVQDMTIRELEDALREAGLSRNEAKALLAGGFKALSAEREAGEGGDVSSLLEAIRRNTSKLKG